uniref:Uncharacterized protein n=1 Tax=Anguilla anguilla TaxID=7936 RepID=A0A0E9PFE0_ANGAN
MVMFPQLPVTSDNISHTALSTCSSF